MWILSKDGLVLAKVNAVIGEITTNGIDIKGVTGDRKHDLGEYSKERAKEVIKEISKKIIELDFNKVVAVNQETYEATEYIDCVYEMPME